MRLWFKQRFFSWFDSYDIYDDAGNPLYTVEGQLAWGHCLKVFDASGAELGTVREVILTFLPRFEIWQGGRCLGTIAREFALFSPRYHIDFMGWDVDGDFLEWDYTIRSGSRVVATVSKELFHWTDTYAIDVVNPADALPALMFVLAIDAEKCSRN